MTSTTMEEGDYLIVSPRKMGQHWMWEIMNMLLAGKAEYMNREKNNFFMDVLPMQKILKEYQPPRVLCTHMSVATIPGNFR